MKNSTILAVVLSWFAVIFFVALELTHPEWFAETHSVDGFDVHGSISNLMAINIMVAPFLATGITLFISYAWYKDNQKVKKSVK